MKLARSFKIKLPWKFDISRMTDSQGSITHILDSDFSVILLTVEIIWSETIINDPYWNGIL